MSYYFACWRNLVENTRPSESSRYSALNLKNKTNIDCSQIKLIESKESQSKSTVISVKHSSNIFATNINALKLFY